MPDAAMWGSVYTVQDNSNARGDSDAEAGSAYERVQEPGVVARGRMVNLGANTEPEARAVWFLVVGSIAFLFLIGKGFKTARA